MIKLGFEFWEVLWVILLTCARNYPKKVKVLNDVKKKQPSLIDSNGIGHNNCKY